MVEGWKEESDQLVRVFECKDFVEAFALMTKIALLAEKSEHHPTMINTYNSLTIKLSTHDAGGVVTDKDEKLAQAINDLVD